MCCRKRLGDSGVIVVDRYAEAILEERFGGMVECVEVSCLSRGG